MKHLSGPFKFSASLWRTQR